MHVENQVNPVKEPCTVRRFLIADSWIFVIAFLAEVLDEVVGEKSPSHQLTLARQSPPKEVGLNACSRQPGPRTRTVELDSRRRRRRSYQTNGIII